MTEHQIQTRFVQLLDRLNATQEAGILYCATMGGVKLTIGQARKCKAAGYRKGIPDLLIYTPSGDKIGLALELKTLTGRPSPEQKEWVKTLTDFGWSASIVKGYDAAVEALFEYFPDLEEPLGH